MQFPSETFLYWEFVYHLWPASLKISFLSMPSNQAFEMLH